MFSLKIVLAMRLAIVVGTVRRLSGAFWSRDNASFIGHQPSTLPTGVFLFSTIRLIACRSLG